MGLFDGWKKKGERVRNAADRRREKLKALYEDEVAANGAV